MEAVNDPPLNEQYDTFVLKFHESELENLLLLDDETKYYSINIDFLKLFEHKADLALLLLSSPNEVLKNFDQSLKKCANEIYESKRNNYNFKNMRLKTKLHCRVEGLKMFPELCRERVPRCVHVGSFLSMAGTVIRTGTIKLLEFEKTFSCNKCKHSFPVQASYEDFFSAIKPNLCPNGGNSCTRGFTSLSSGVSSRVCRNYQEIKIQEQATRLKLGTVPRSIWVVLMDDLVDCCKPGDDVIVTGIVRRRWSVVQKDKAEVELSIDANHVIVVNCQEVQVSLTTEEKKDFLDFWMSFSWSPLEGRNLILRSFCPQVHGLYLVKLALAMVLVGGVQRVDDLGTKVRGECHLLMVGDPGTGKSQLMKYCGKICSRSVSTTGVGSTNAGLTVAAVKDSGEWHLEAGALVLADGGICCIDEFNSIRNEDKASIHEAMEQQSISVAKAGLVCKLNTRCSVIASTNSKGKYDLNQSISTNTAIASPLLSRFDLVLLLLDTQNPQWDFQVSNFILQLDKGECLKGEIWTLERMRTYFGMVKTLKPTLSTNAKRILTAYYKEQRKGGSEGRLQWGKPTMRVLEGLIRLSQAHAKLMMREEVGVEDALTAVMVSHYSLNQNNENEDALHCPFPEDAEEDYVSMAHYFLEKLELYDILEKEMEKFKDKYFNINNSNTNIINSKETINNNNSDNENNNNINNADIFNFIISEKNNQNNKKNKIFSSQPLKKTKNNKEDFLGRFSQKINSLPNFTNQSTKSNENSTYQSNQRSTNLSTQSNQVPINQLTQKTIYQPDKESTNQSTQLDQGSINQSMLDNIFSLECNKISLDDDVEMETLTKIKNKRKYSEQEKEEEKDEKEARLGLKVDLNNNLKNKNKKVDVFSKLKKFVYIPKEDEEEEEEDEQKNNVDKNYNTNITSSTDIIIGNNTNNNEDKNNKNCDNKLNHSLFKVGFQL